MSVASIISNAASQITNAIGQAARSTGISFEYLLTTARIESRLDPSAQAPTSSASGLFQFIDQTWLGTLKRAGPALGYGSYANAIVQGADGRYTVPDPTMRTAIMRLRDDPKVSALMAGAFTRSNASQLASAIGRRPTEGELYIAHVLGSDGATRLIATAATQPQANAAQMFPRAATANRDIFFDKLGRGRSAGAVYAELTGRYELARTISVAPHLRGSGGVPAASAPDTAGVTQALAQAAPPPAPDNRPLFQAMFTDRAAMPLTPAVQRLWSADQTGSVNDATGQATASGQSNALDLFTDHRRDTRALFGEDPT